MSFLYPSTIRNITISLLNLYNDIKVSRYTTSGTVRKIINVPITFGPEEKFFFIRKENYSQEDGQKYYLQLPRLALTFDGLNYNSDRATGVNEIRTWYADTLRLQDIEHFYSDPQPVPYDYNFSLYIMTESMEDFSQIVEGILPYYNPCLHLRVKEFSFLNIERDLKVTLNSVNPDFLYRQEETTKRYVNGTISLTVEGFMYYPVQTSATGVVKIIHSQYFIDQSNVLGGTSAFEISDYVTSGTQATSAGLPELSAVSGIPSSGYSYSGNYQGPPNIYWSTSAINYNI